MKALKVEPGRIPELIEIENELEALQDAVGGDVECVTIASDAAILCDEEGLLKGKPVNFTFCGLTIVGTALFEGVDGEEFCDIDAEAVQYLTRGRALEERAGVCEEEKPC